jgi:hypothetical protein
MRLIPCSQRDAAAFLSVHRHLPDIVGGKACIAAEHEGKVVGVCVLGRPVSRHLDDGSRLEVLRLATDGTTNSCSFLLGRARRLAAALGYREIVTYTRHDESGASLRGAGFRVVGTVSGRQWDCPARPRSHREPELRLSWRAAA